MDWFGWIIVIVAALVILGGVGDIGRRNQPKSGAGKLRVSPDERTAKLIDESFEIAKRTKKRDTAESRLKLAEELINELVKEKSGWIDEKTCRSRLNRIRSSLDSRFPKKAAK